MSVSEIDRLIQLLSKLPGLGPRSARRAVLHLMTKRDSLMTPLAEAMKEAALKVQECEICGNLDSASPCNICSNGKRDQKIICVVEHVSDLWALERAGVFSGLYHILGGTLSALDGIGPDDLNVEGLLSRVQAGGVVEVILAMNATIDGQTTAHYLTDRLEDMEMPEQTLQISRLAHGVPVGGELDYLDDGTLAAALKSRRSV